MENRWKKAIALRSDLDHKLTGKRLGRKALDRKLVIETWEGTGLLNPLPPPSNEAISGILVGSQHESRIGVG